MAKILIPRERLPGETRVAASPDSVRRLTKGGLEVVVEAGAGEAAFLSDEAFAAAGARIAADVQSELPTADIVAKVRPFETAEAEALKEGAVAVALMAPYRNHDMVRIFRERRVAALALELIPRITRAQKMDVLSSQANIAGYKAVLLAAGHLPKYFPLLMTAAGTVKPARVVVMGAGVAGLSAVATARRLGAVVEVSDIRAEVKEQVESLGGKFIELPDMQSGGQTGGYAKEVTRDFLEKQQAIVSEHVAAADVVITTALVPGRPAPKLVTEAMVQRMRPGSVIVDLAVEQGGNCEVSVAGEDVVRHGVLVMGPANLPATVPLDASTLFARNVQEMVLPLLKDGRVVIDLDDEVVAGALLTHDGEIRHAPTREAMEGAAS